MSYEIKPSPGSVHKKSRRGCGRGSGLGKTCGFGTKGQKMRSGQARPYMGFEGGQTPLYRRLPKRGFFHEGTEFEVVNVDQLNIFDNGATVNITTLKEKGLIKKSYLPLKVLGDGELKKKINVEAVKITVTVKEKIEKSGGSVKLIEG